MRAEMGKDPSRAPPSQLNLPPGFRFYPTDEELVVHYLCKKAASEPFTIPIIAEIELYKFDPWDLPERALFGEKEWYFFSPRDRKYPNGSRPNRAAGTGYWKATGTDKPILTMAGSKKVGVKKALVFYRGKAPKGLKTNWIMHEYRLADSAARSAKKKGTLRLDDWVLCRIYKKCSSAAGAQKAVNTKEQSESSGLDNVTSPLPGSHINRLMSPNLGSMDEGAYVDDKRMVSLHELYQNGQTYPTRHMSDVNLYLQEMQAGWSLETMTQKHSSITSEQQGAASSADMSNAGSPSNVYSSRHTASEGSVQAEDDAAESTFNTLPTAFAPEQMNAFPQSLYGLDAGGLLPSPTSMMLGQGSFATVLDGDYNSFFSNSDFNLQMRPFSRGPHLGSTWDGKINFAT